jgi:DNA polymerase-3 subunit delta
LIRRNAQDSIKKRDVSMPLKPEQLQQQLARRCAGVVVLAGDEPLFVEEAADVVRRMAREQGFDEREVHHADADYDWGRLHDTCATGSLFSSRRVVELRCQGLDAAAGTTLCELAAHAGEDLLILVIAGALESRVRKAKWFSRLDAETTLVYAWGLRGGESGRWIQERLRAAGLRAEPEAIAMLAERTEGNVQAAAQLIRQLILLAPEGRVNLALVAEVSADVARFDPFAVMDLVFAGDAERAVRGVRRLREEGLELPAVVPGIAYVTRQWLGAHMQLARNGDANAAMRAVGVFPPRSQMLLRALQRTRPAQVQRLLRQLAGIDLASKQGGADAAWNDLITWVLSAARADMTGFLVNAT